MLTTAHEAKKARLHTPDVLVQDLTDGSLHKPAVFDAFVGSPAEKAQYLVDHAGTVSARTAAQEQIRRGTKIVKLDKELAALGSPSLATIAAG